MGTWEWPGSCNHYFIADDELVPTGNDHGFDFHWVHIYYHQKTTMVSQAEQSQVYLTFVYVDAAVPLECHAITIPLKNIVMAGDSTLTVNIKPTAPEVTRTVKVDTGRPNDYITYATRSISAKYIKNASILASAIARHIQN